MFSVSKAEHASTVGPTLNISCMWWRRGGGGGFLFSSYKHVVDFLQVLLLSIVILLFLDEVVTLTSQCISEDGDFQLTCTVQNVAHLFWFFNGSNTRHYEYFRGSEDEQCPCDPTFDSMLPGVQVTVQEATGADRFDAVSLLSANLSSLSALNVHSVECGSANTRSQSVIINSDIRCKYHLLCRHALLC